MIKETERKKNMVNLAKEELYSLIEKHKDEITKKDIRELAREIAIKMSGEGANVPPIDELQVIALEALMEYRQKHDLY